MSDTYTVRQGAMAFQLGFVLIAVSVVVLGYFLLQMFLYPNIPTTRSEFIAPEVIADQVLLMGTVLVCGMLSAFIRHGHLIYEGGVQKLSDRLDNLLRGIQFIVLVLALGVMGTWAKTWINIEEYNRASGIVVTSLFFLWLGHFIISGVLKGCFTEAFEEDLKQAEMDEILHMKDVVIPELISEVNAKCFGDDVSNLSQEQFQMLIDLKSLSQDMKHLNQLKKFAAELRYFIEKGVSYNAGKVLLQEKIDRSKLRKTI